VKSGKTRSINGKTKLKNGKTKSKNGKTKLKNGKTKSINGKTKTKNGKTSNLVTPAAASLAMALRLKLPIANSHCLSRLPEKKY
jgi:hypothetical protein